MHMQPANQLPSKWNNMINLMKHSSNLTLPYAVSINTFYFLSICPCGHCLKNARPTRCPVSQRLRMVSQAFACHLHMINFIRPQFTPPCSAVFFCDISKLGSLVIRKTIRTNFHAFLSAIDYLMMGLGEPHTVYRIWALSLKKISNTDNLSGWVKHRKHVPASHVTHLRIVSWCGWLASHAGPHHHQFFRFAFTWHRCFLPSGPFRPLLTCGVRLKSKKASSFCFQCCNTSQLRVKAKARGFCCPAVAATSDYYLTPDF